MLRFIWMPLTAGRALKIIKAEAQSLSTSIRTTRDLPAAAIASAAALLCIYRTRSP